MNKLVASWISSDDGKRFNETELELDALHLELIGVQAKITNKDLKIYKLFSSDGKKVEKVERYESQDLLTLRVKFNKLRAERANLLKSLIKARREHYFQHGY